MDKKKNLPVPSTKSEIKVKKNPTAEAIKRAPDEVVARAIHEALVKDHEKGITGKK